MKNQSNLTEKLKSAGRYALILLACFSLFITSCKKKDNPPANAGFVYTDDVYVAGSYTTGGIGYPAYWKNGQKVELLDLNGKKEEGEVMDIAVSGSDIYAVGYCKPSSKQVILWKNGKAIKVTEDDKIASVSAIAISGTDVYIAGNQKGANNKFVPMYWKINGNVSIPSKDLTQGAYPNNDVYGKAIALIKNKIYVTGFIFNLSASQAALWTDDGTVISQSILNNTPANAYGCGFAILGNDVYIGGYEDYNVKFWKNDKNYHVDFSTTHHSATSNGRIIAIDANNKVHMVGSDVSATLAKAMYWKEGSTPVTLTAGSATTNEWGASIALAGNNVYVTGYFPSDPNHLTSDPNHLRSILWKNGEKVPGFEGSQDIYARALFVVKK